MAARKTTSSTRSRSRGAAATASKSRLRNSTKEAEEYVEITGSDFPDTWDFEERGDLEGVFKGTVEKEIKGKDRTIHTVEHDGEDFQVWGAAILDSRLGDLDEGTYVKIVKTGKKIKTRSGHQAAEYKVFARKGSLKQGR